MLGSLTYFISFKGNARPDWICMRVVLLDRPWKGHQPGYRFFFLFFFFFDLEYLIRVQSFEPLHEKWIQPPACLDHSLYVLNLQSFPSNRAPKMRERHQFFKTGQDWWDWLEICNTFTFLENDARQRGFVVGQKTHSYSTFGNVLSYSVEFRALSLLGIKILNV